MSRSVLVTGGNRGIGLAIARALHAAGDRVAVTYHTGEPPHGLLAVSCDVTNPEQVEKAFARIEMDHGPVEVLVACAGVTKDKLLLQMSEEDFSSVLDTNLTGVFRVVKRATRHMIRTRSGRIILISATVALSGEAGQVNYGASKAGIVGFARSLARELGSRGITVNVVSPGLTDTSMTENLTSQQRKKLVDRIPLGRSAQPKEIAAAVAFLSSSAASYITGAVLPVDGGMGMGH